MPRPCRSLSCPTSWREGAQPGLGRVTNESLFLHIYVTLAYLSLRCLGAKSFAPACSSRAPRASLGCAWSRAGGEPRAAPEPRHGQGSRGSLPRAGRARAALSFQPCAPRHREGLWLRCLGESCFCMAPPHLPSVGRGPPRATRWPWGRYRLLAEGKCKSHYVLGHVWN